MKTLDEIFFHEDNYCQIELLPKNQLQNDLANTTLDNYRQFDFANDQSLDAFGSERNEYPLKDLNINIASFDTILKGKAKIYFPKVYTGYSTFRTLKVNTIAYGFENYVFYLEFSSNIVTKCWIGYHNVTNDSDVYPLKLSEVLFKLGTSYKLFLMDWTEFFPIDLENKLILSHYLKNYL